MIELSSPARWYTVALSESLPAAQPKAVRCDGREYVLFRDAQGQAHALVDRCAHRRAALSLGSVTAGGLLQCPYHGWRYNGQTGACESIPNLAEHERVPRTYRVASFPVVEEAGWLHLWSEPGEPSYPPPQLELGTGSQRWQDEALISYPHDALADLLVDAPSAVLRVAGLTIFDLHRFGDPALTPDHLTVTYAAAAKARRPANKIIADFSRFVTIRLSRDGAIAHVDLRTDTGETLSALIVAISPVARAVSSVKWRGHTAGELGDTRIDVQPTIDATAASEALDYCSRLRTRIGNQTPKALEGSVHERANS
jgi:nitrite reductase/ring-hydroxylating ferredoxin subunit